MALYSNNIVDKYSKLKKDPTAFSPGVSPTKFQLNLEQEYFKQKKTRDTARDEELRLKYYGTGDNRTDNKEGRGVLGKFLQILGAPLHVSAGITESLLGRGTKKGIANVYENVKEEGTYGDILRGYGLNNYASMPLGFALDVALDPINWATMGTEALIPRIGAGLLKGGVKGAATGLKSGLLGKAETLGKFIPGMTKRVGMVDDIVKTIPTANRVGKLDDMLKHLPDYMREGTEETAETLAKREGINASYRPGKVTETYYNMLGSANSANEKYAEVIGKSVLDKVEYYANRRGFLNLGISDKLDKTETGRGMKRMFQMSPKESHNLAKATEDIATEKKIGDVFDDVYKSKGKDIDDLDELMKTSPKALDDDLENAMQKNMDDINNPEYANNSRDVQEQMAEQYIGSEKEKMMLARSFNELTNHFTNIVGTGGNKSRTLAKLESLTEIEKEGVARTAQYYKSGVEWYDKLVGRALSSKTGRSVLKNYSIGLSAFKIAKIGGNILTGGMNAMVGNMFMAGMRGINVFDREFIASMNASRKVILSKNPEEALKLFKSDAWRQYLTRYPKVFESVTGLNANAVLRGKEYVNELTAKIVAETGQKISPKDGNKFRDIIYDAFIGKSNTVREAGKNATRARASADRGIDTISISGEVLAGDMNKVVKWAEKAAEDGSSLAKLLHWYLTKPMDAYNKFDQLYRVALVTHLTNKGVSGKELKMIARLTDFAGDDISKVAGRNMYKISPERAMEITNDTFMDYLAMPGFVNIMRTLPIAGSPFMCRSEDTEVLTNSGWKRYDELGNDDLAMSYNLKGKYLEWKPIVNVHIYDVIDEDLYHVKSRSLDIIASPDHDVVVASKKNIEKGKVDGKRVRSSVEFVPKKVKIKKIIDSTTLSIVVGAENGYKTNNFQIYSDEIVELIGWFVTEGFYRYKRKSGEYGSFCLCQARPEGVDKIKNLIDRLGVKCNIQIKKKKKGTMMNYDNYTFCFSAELKRILDSVIPNKQLTISFLNSLTKKQLVLLYDTMILADGSVSKDGAEVFCQKDNETYESFQVLSLMIGRSCTDYGDKNGLRNGNNILGVNKGLYRQLKRNKPKKIKYTGKIWCPQVLGNGTWVAKRNGKIDITGNSFAYGMSAKTVNTLLYNASFFNKVNFLLKEVSGGKSPVEKAKLESKYYSWLDEPGMLKIPFFRDNPTYLNMQQMIPYYTLNVFQPSERSYTEKYGKSVGALIDKSPFFKTPEGQIMLDYFVIPYILKENNPEGMFGQPLTTRDASVGEKLGKATSSLVESFVPPLTGLAGPIAGSMDSIPESWVPYIPSFRFRQMYNAAQGKTSLGISSNEPSVQRVFRTGAGMAGMPTYNINNKYGLTKEELDKYK